VPSRAADLIDDGIYDGIAIALHTHPHRSVSLGLVATALGASPRSGRKKVNAGQVVEVASTTAPAATSKITSSSV
jgi:hypothetical protein